MFVEVTEEKFRIGLAYNPKLRNLYTFAQHENSKM